MTTPQTLQDLSLSELLLLYNMFWEGQNADGSYNRANAIELDYENMFNVEKEIKSRLSKINFNNTKTDNHDK